MYRAYTVDSFWFAVENNLMQAGPYYYKIK